MQMKKTRPRDAATRSWTSERLVVFAVCVYLAGITWIVFGQTLGHGFFNYDDPQAVSEVAEVTHGLSLKGIAWAFTHTLIGHWDPLTTLSHMADCQIFGLAPAGHHLTNVLLHMTTAILLFLVLREMTGAIWRSAFVAALFAVHPLRVESVAWITERKDVLSGVFFMLTLGAYTRYTRAPSVRRYLAVALAFALGLMCKSMLVTVPFVLLLLDYWPLGRWAQTVPDVGAAHARRRLWTPLLEKLPLLLLSATSIAIQIFAVRGMIRPATALPLLPRVVNALASYVAYIGQMIYPVGLTVLYPFPYQGFPLWKAIYVILLLAGISGWAFASRRKHPYVLTGWLWYLGMLVPVIGLVQVGDQARADRYTYLPQIGLALLATWTVADLSASWRHRRLLLGAAAGTAIALLTLVAHAQTAYWRDSQTLWEHTLTCTRYNAMAHNNLGNALFEKGDTDAAILQFQKTIEIAPRYAAGHYNLGLALSKKGLKDASTAQFQAAIEIQPDDLDSLLNLGNALREKGEVDAAIAQYRKALDARPDDQKVNYDLGNALFQKGMAKDAISHFEKALKADPLSVQTLNNMAWVLATCADQTLRNPPRAVELARRANEICAGRNPDVLRTLATAHAANGEFPAALEAASQALQLASSADNANLKSILQKEIGRYEANSRGAASSR